MPRMGEEAHNEKVSSAGQSGPILAVPTMAELNLAVLEVARQYIGVREIGGPNRGPEVELFQKAVDGRATSEAWCMAFVQFSIKAVEDMHGIESRLHRSENCLAVWTRTPPELRLAINFPPGPGHIMIWNVPGTERGHAGIIMGRNTEGNFLTVEGNTNDAGSREGDGVYVKTRTPTGSERFRVLGWLRAFA